MLRWSGRRIEVNAESPDPTASRLRQPDELAGAQQVAIPQTSLPKGKDTQRGANQTARPGQTLLIKGKDTQRGANQTARPGQTLLIRGRLPSTIACASQSCLSDATSFAKDPSRRLRWWSAGRSIEEVPGPSAVTAVAAMPRARFVRAALKTRPDLGVTG